MTKNSTPSATQIPAVMATNLKILRFADRSCAVPVTASGEDTAEDTGRSFSSPDRTAEAANCSGCPRIGLQWGATWRRRSRSSAARPLFPDRCIAAASPNVARSWRVGNDRRRNSLQAPGCPSATRCSHRFAAAKQLDDALRAQTDGQDQRGLAIPVDFRAWSSLPLCHKVLEHAKSDDWGSPRLSAGPRRRRTACRGASGRADRPARGRTRPVRGRRTVRRAPRAPAPPRP